MADKYAVNYEDERFKNVENEKNQQITETTNRYDNMINNTDKFYQDQINASKDWANKQTEIQQQQTDFAIEQINQQREKAEKDYQREQKASYVDYTKQIDPFSIDSEKMAANGLQNSGYSESSRVSMWNAYQNRYAKARESFTNASINFDNGIKEAQLANNSALAQIAYNALQNELELSLQGFKYKNELIQTKEAQLQNINDNYNNRYQNVLAQINQEIEWKRQQDEREETNRQWWEEFNLRKQQYAIENGRAEKQLQAALANEGNYVVSEGKISDNSNNNALAAVLGGTAAAINKSSNSQALTSNGQSVYNYIQNRRTGVKALDRLSNGAARKYITQQYENNIISDADAQILFSKLGL